jgi:RHS repeat-associated protein
MYQAYGKMVPLAVQTDPVRMTFTTKEFDSESGMGLYYFGARYLDPEIGAWTSTDPKGQYRNPYKYSSNPINTIDPDGQWVGAVLGVFKWYVGGMMSNGGKINPYNWNWNDAGLWMGTASTAFSVGMDVGNDIVSFSRSRAPYKMRLAENTSDDNSGSTAIDKTSISYDFKLEQPAPTDIRQAEMRQGSGYDWGIALSDAINETRSTEDWGVLNFVPAGALANRGRIAVTEARTLTAARQATKYIDVSGKSSVRNIGTDAIRKIFEQNLIDSGWLKTTSKDGLVSIFEKNGAK